MGGWASFLPIDQNYNDLHNMHGICLKEPHRFERVELPEPSAPGAGEALVATHRVGICGTDVGGYLGKMPFFEYPRLIGHELGVEVLAVGDGVDNVAVGDRCCVRPYIVCDDCYSCRRGAVNCCVTSKTLGVMCDGGLCERFVIDAKLLHKSDKLTFEQLALVETLGIGCHAVDRSDVQPGDNALLIGAGPIGLSALEFLLVAEANVTVLDLSPERLEFVQTHYPGVQTVQPVDGLLERFAELTNGELYPVVIDATGHAGSMATAASYLAQTGTLVYVGINQGEIPLHHPTFHKAEATIRASRNALPKDFERIIQLIEDGVIDTNRWITHRTSMDAMIENFDTYTRPESGVVKAIVEVTA